MADYAKTGSKDFGDLLRRSRERQGMSRKDLAIATGLSYPYISQLETGYRQPSPSAIKNLAIALQISLDEMFAAMQGPRTEPEPFPMSATHSDWVRNENYSGLEIDHQRPRKFSSDGFARPAAHVGEFAEIHEPPGGARDVYGDGTDSGDPLAESIEEVISALARLSPTERLEAIARVQILAIQEVIDDGIRKGQQS